MMRQILFVLVALTGLLAGCGDDGAEPDGGGVDSGANDASMRDAPIADAPIADAPVDDRPVPTDGGVPTRPISVHPDNPRYFADPRGNPLRLAGHQIFVDLQDNSFNKDDTYGMAAELDWSWYLDFATERSLNAIRNWVIWSTGSGTAAPPDRIAHPMMYARTGPGMAADGMPRFDLTMFDESFFDRMRMRVQQAGERGITVIVMLFEVYGFGPGEDEGGQTLWHGNVFRGANNINGIDVNTDGNAWGMEFFYTDDPMILALQRAYVDKVIDTLADLDNVIYEVANELLATAWQHDMVRYIHEQEAGRPKQHLVYMSPGGRTVTGSWTRHSWDDLADSGADVLGIAGSMGDFENDPPVAVPVQPLIWDNDHVWGMDWQHRRRAWMSFTRGYHFIFYDAPFENPEMESPAFETMRRNIGATNDYAGRFADLAAMEPHGELASTGFCLASPDSEYLVYAPTGEPFTVELSAGDFTYEWFDPSTYSTGETGMMTAAGGAETFTPPAAAEDAVLYLRGG